MRRCERIEVEAGEIIVSAGDAANSMHFILDGRVGVMVPTDEGAPRGCAASAATPRSARWAWSRSAPRSATIQAEVASVLYVLSAPQFEAIKPTTPPSARSY